MARTELSSPKGQCDKRPLRGSADPLPCQQRACTRSLLPRVLKPRAESGEETGRRMWGRPLPANMPNAPRTQARKRTAPKVKALPSPNSV